MGTENRRINTQMPRRMKIRTAIPMASEWDIDTGSPPSGLRTPSDKMGPAPIHRPRAERCGGDCKN